MNDENGKPVRPSIWQSEDWWACFIGWFILLLAIFGVLPATPKIGTWSSLSAIFPKGWATLGTAFVLLLTMGVVTVVGGIFMKFDLRGYIPGFIVIFLISLLSMILAKQSFISKMHISSVLFALIIGLIISNVFRVPKILKDAGQTEYFVKIGLVCMGATIMFTTIVRAGAVGVAQALIVASAAWFFTYWLARKVGLSERFSAIIATGNSICGVSATIAAGGALQGDSKEVGYMVAWVMICAVVLILVMPPIAIWLDLPNNMAGAWLGGVIDNTGAVIAAGEMIKGKAAVDAAAIVKMAQNVLIGFVAFLMALWAALSLDRAEGAERPSFMEIWYRFPKFVIGFMVASIIVSLVVDPVLGEKTTNAISKACKSYRSWFFALCFVAIGLETDFKELLTVGGGKPAAVYWFAQIVDAIWTLLIVWILWSGAFFTPAILPD